LKALPVLLLIAGGEKVQAARALLRSGVINGLIIDGDAAEALGRDRRVAAPGRQRLISATSRKNAASLPLHGANENARRAHQPAELSEEFGAGEAIRTPDPNLGKVVLYP
jgi:hypothetical protein